jgi:hypothetical protein
MVRLLGLDGGLQSQSVSHASIWKPVCWRLSVVNSAIGTSGAAGRLSKVNSAMYCGHRGWGAQVVRTNADLLHFHSTPSALDSSIGGVDLI